MTWEIVHTNPATGQVHRSGDVGELFHDYRSANIVRHTYLAEDRARIVASGLQREGLVA